MIVAEIDADRITGEHNQISGHERLLAGVVFGGPGTGDRGHHAGPGIVATDLVGLRVGDVEHVVLVERHGRGPCEIHFQGGSIAVEPVLTGAHDGRDDPGVAVDLPDTVAAGVADVEMVLGIEGDV